MRQVRFPQRLRRVGRARRASTRIALLALTAFIALPPRAAAEEDAAAHAEMATASSASAASTAAWPLVRAVTTLRFDEVALGRLGLRLVRVEPSAAAPPAH